MRWYAQLDMHGKLTIDQIHAALVEPVTAVVPNDAAGTVKIRLTVDTADDAVPPGAVDLLDEAPAVRALIADGALSRPFLCLVRTEDAEEQELAILSTAGTARRLGMSDARVRQLKDTDPTFPRPFPIPGAAGDFYRTADVDGYAGRRKTGAADAGRPRATDEPLLVAALRAVLQTASINDPYRHQIEQALATQGGRYVRGKALLLARLPSGHRAEVEKWLAGEALDAFRATIVRAHELVGG